MKKKTLACIAALVAAGSASAQSSVTLFGVLDAAVSYYQTNSKYVNAFNPANPALPVPHPDVRQSQWVLSSGNYTGSRVGFRGTEDLGGGLAASFWLEAGIANDTGASLTPIGVAFNRRSTVSLSGAFGEVRLGRDYTPTFWNDNVFDPFQTVGVGAVAISMLLGGAGSAGTIGNLVVNPNYVRASNSVSYFLPPDLGGFYGHVMYAFGENTKYDPGTLTPPTPNTARTGRYAGARLGYANGPLDVAAAYGSSVVGDDYFAGITKYLNTGNIAGSYDFGPAKLFGEYSHVELQNDRKIQSPFAPSGDITITGYLLGLTVPVGPGLIRASYSHLQADLKNVAQASPGVSVPDPKADKLALGYVHNLSKRTLLYATFGYTKNKNGAAIPPALPPNGNVGYLNPSVTDLLNQSAGYRADTGYGYDLGIRHVF
ncbi:Outer membrane protein (porin) [Variovorax sp. HW608]|uniref:porin n=1 Tax=Variovorax sp. HW608 TaxID=1034889 RepID=UPI000820113B|nr:porin [Variovorax sp. HW608]SCK17713.1 Outer membrane protein (porin) [Variovorax sp. HW608]